MYEGNECKISFAKNNFSAQKKHKSQPNASVGITTLLLQI
jgi:hypothetical protein